jgi:transposase InsO family protein
MVFLARKGIVISKITAFKYMNKELNLHSVIMKKRPKYIRGEKNKVFPNILNQNFLVSGKNKVWCTDFTQARHNCSIIDLHDRSVVASSNSRYINVI